VAPREEQLGRDDVLADPSHVLPGEGRGLDADALRIESLHGFDHDHCVGAAGQYVAGVDEKGLSADRQIPGLGFVGPIGGLGVDRDTVHGGRMIVGRGDGRKDRFGQHPPGRLRDRDRFNRQRLKRRQLLEHDSACLV
jgi:hypothetical protein